MKPRNSTVSENRAKEKFRKYLTGVIKRYIHTKFNDTKLAKECARDLTIELENYVSDEFGRIYFEEARMVVNWYLCLVNSIIEIDQHVIHEFLHLYRYRLTGNPLANHEPPWDDCMRKLGFTKDLSSHMLIKPFSFELVCKDCGEIFIFESKNVSHFCLICGSDNVKSRSIPSEYFKGILG